MLAGVAYGGSPISTRALVDPRFNAETIVPAATVRVYGLLGFWLYSRALRRAAVTAVNAPLILLETLVPAAIGVWGSTTRSDPAGRPSPCSASR